MNRSIGLKWRLIIYYHYHSFTCLLFKAFEPFHNIYSRIDWKQKKTSFGNSFHCFAWIQTLCIDWKDNHYLWIKEFFSHPFPFRINYLVAIFKTNLKQFSYLNVGWRCWMVMNIQFIHLNNIPSNPIDGNDVNVSTAKQFQVEFQSERHKNFNIKY